jgi:hypothetical protein
MKKLSVLFSLWLLASLSAADPGYFGIQVVDAETGRGVPLIHLRTVNEIDFITDSRGWVAFDEPSLLGKEVFFTVEGPNYEYPKDGFGFRGTKLLAEPGKTVTLKVKRLHPAERMTRLTGSGIYRDSQLLKIEGIPKPTEPTLGQDSVQAVAYRKQLFWLWGDTNLANYPLGNFQTTAATSPLPDPDSKEPIRFVDYHYFMDAKKSDRVRRMMPHSEPGVVWLFGLLTVRDREEREILLAHFTRRKSLTEELEQGLVQFDDEAGVFKKIETFSLKEPWRFPRNNAFRVTESKTDFYYFAAPFAYTRVAAKLASVRDSVQYQSYYFDEEAKEYRWQQQKPPTTQEDERKLLKSGKMPAEKARYQLLDIQSNEPITLHGGSISYNDYRNKWILLALQSGDRKAPSHLGEVWYAEADSPTGPWTKAIKIASHPNYSFYNPRLHDFFSQEGGRIIYFEGTYTHTFSGNPKTVPRYEYNQLLYRLDLGDPRLNITDS